MSAEIDSGAQVVRRAVVVDDEAPARQLLRELLEERDDVEVVAECANGFEAAKTIPELRPDVVFLDVQMPKLDGFEVLELLGDERPAVIFVTAYDDYALRAFAVHAVHYLLKPVTAEALAEAVARLGGGGTSPPPPAELATTARAGRSIDRVLVRDGGKIHVVASDRLDYVEAQDDYVRLVTSGASLRKQQKLGELEALLDPERFVRIHRSYLLNLDRLDRLELYAKDSRVAILRDGTRLPVSRAGYGRLRQLL